MKKLFEIVNHAYQTVPFYKELAKDNDNFDRDITTMEEFQKLPLINKQMFQEHMDQTLSEKYLHYPYFENLTIRRTSGSTGRYMKIYWDINDTNKALWELWLKRKKYYDISPRDKYCYFYTTNYILNKLVQEEDISLSRDARTLGFSKNGLNNEKLIEITKKIYEFNPKYLLIQPSMAILIADCLEQNHMPKFRDLKYIEVTGEMLLDSVKQRLEDVFECKICNQYGCNEADSIASNSGDDLLHVHQSNVYIEIVRHGKVMPYGEYGDIYITSLTNYAMPFIRYNIGDQGRLIQQGEDLILELKRGRSSEFIIDENNERLPFYILLRPIEHINEKIGNIINQFQVIQNDINDFTVRLSIKPNYIGWKKTIEKLYVENIKQPSLENANWNFEFHNQFYPENNTGKLSYFKNDISKGDKDGR